MYLDVHLSGVADVLAEFQLSLNEDLQFFDTGRILLCLFSQTSWISLAPSLAAFVIPSRRVRNNFLTSSSTGLLLRYVLHAILYICRNPFHRQLDRLNVAVRFL
jgi:hypothetical protein